MRGDALNRVTSEYPPRAKKKNIQGDVVVGIIIDETGTVTRAFALNGHPLLQPAAVKAAREWKFRPKLVDQMRVKTTKILTFRFSL